MILIDFLSSLLSRSTRIGCLPTANSNKSVTCFERPSEGFHASHRTDRRSSKRYFNTAEIGLVADPEA